MQWESGDSKTRLLLENIWQGKRRYKPKLGSLRQEKDIFHWIFKWLISFVCPSRSTLCPSVILHYICFSSFLFSLESEIPVCSKRRGEGYKMFIPSLLLVDNHRLVVSLRWFHILPKTLVFARSQVLVPAHSILSDWMAKNTPFSLSLSFGFNKPVTYL